MNRFFRNSLFVLLGMLALTLSPSVALAADCTGAFGFPDPLCAPDAAALVNRLISAVLGLVGALFFVMFLWGGFRYMTAGGEAKKIQSARTILVNAVIGIIIVGLSYAIVLGIINTLEAGKAVAPAAPTP